MSIDENDMTHTRIQESLAAFALDAVDRLERDRIDHHLDECAGCRDEVDAFLSVAAELHIGEETPPPTVWERIETRIDRDDERTDRTRHKVTPIRARRPRIDPPWLAVAAVASLVVALGIQTTRLGQTRTNLAEAEARASELETMLDAGLTEEVAIRAAATPNATTAVLSGTLGNGTIVILPDGTGFLIADDLPALDAEQTYQLWAVQGGQVISAGLLGSDPRVVAFHIDPELLEGLVISAEQAGGVPVSSQTEASAWFRDA